MFLAITGASGYIGSHLTSLSLERGHDVLVASRQKIPTPSVAWIPFDFSSPSPMELPDGLDVVIHLAANTKNVKCVEETLEVAVAKDLLTASQKIGAKLIFVSSQTARPEAPSSYGRIKWRIEQEVIASGGWVVRPGLVYGGQLLGLYGTLVNIVQKFPLLPAFLPAPKVQPIHVNDLVEGLLRIAERHDIPSGVYSLGAPEHVYFSKFLNEIARVRLHRCRIYVPVPVVVIDILSKLMGKSLRVRFGFESIRSLFTLPFMETASNLNQIGLVLRPLHFGLHRSGNGRKRCLLREGQALLTYVLKKPPSNATLRRYLRAIELLRGGKVLDLPKTFLICPMLISLIDDFTLADEAIMAELSWRLDAATLLAEATTSGAYRFLGFYSKQNVLVSLFSVTAAVGCEVFWRSAQIIFSPLIRLAFRRAKASN